MRHTLMSWLVAATLLGAAPAMAGIAPLPDMNDDLRVLADELGKTFEISVAPLLDPAAVAIAPPGECASSAPNVHALLIAGRDIPAGPIEGPENDIGLLTAALNARTDGAAQIVALRGDAVRPEPVRQAMLDLVSRVACGDRVFLHFGGLSLTGQELLLAMADSLFEGDVDRIRRGDRVRVVHTRRLRHVRSLDVG